MATSSIQYDKTPPIISVRSSEGVYLLKPDEEAGYSKFSKLNNFHDENKNCRINAFDSTGTLFAYCNGNQVFIVNVKQDCKILATIDRPRTSFLKFSPRGSYLILWETFYVTKDEHKEVENLNIYQTSNGSLFKALVQRKFLEHNMVQWLPDESAFAVQINGEVQFFECSNPNVVSKRIKMENMAGFSFCGVSKTIAVHASGKKNEPSFIRLYRYPDVTNVISNKSFFNADKVEFKWNKSGTNLLLLCSTETSQNSYYGDTTLHQIGTNGESQFVQLSKKGPIYALEWNPNKEEFIVIYGTMPAKATLFNSKCEAIYDFGTGPRNEIYFNPHGNIVCICGFGNLRGKIEIWNLNTPNKVPLEVCSIQADDTTFFEWSPDGEHILTATTAPRLRVSNGFKIWNVLGENKFTYQLPEKNELWQIEFQPGKYAQKNLAKTVVPVAKEETKAYVPPHLRNKSGAVASNFSTKLRNDEEKPDKSLKIKPKKGEDEELDLEKKIKTIKKKLAQIEELKKKQSSGQVLEKNQSDKLSSEADLISELSKLSV